MFPSSNSANELVGRLYKKFDLPGKRIGSPPRQINLSRIEEKPLVPRIAKRTGPTTGDATTQNITSNLPLAIKNGKVFIVPKQNDRQISNINMTGNSLPNFQQSFIQGRGDQSTLNLSISGLGPDLTGNSGNKRQEMTMRTDHIKIVDEINEKELPSNINASKGVAASTFGRKKKPTLKERSTLRKKNKEEKKENEYYLTPMDFIHLIRTDPEMADEFCYLNKRSHPYDFQIVEFDERHPTEYMTISARGITHFIDSEAEFMTIEEWEREVKMYHKLREFPFFKKYKIWKNFSLWKKLMRRNIMKDCSNVLSQQLFLLDKHLRRPLVEIRNICLHISKLEYMDLSFTEPVKYEEFRTLQENYRVTLMDKKFETLENAIKEMVINSCQNSLTAFKEENRIPNKDPDNPNADNDEPPPHLVGDDTNKEMPYTQEATIRTHYKRLQKFIKLIDYLILNSKLAMMSFSTERLYEAVLEHNQNAKDNKANIRNSSWIVCEIGHKELDVVFIPNRETTKKIFEEVVNKGIQRICHKHKQLIHLPELITYSKIGELNDEAQEEAIDLLNLIYSDEFFKFVNSGLKTEIEISFDKIVEHSQFLKPFLQIYIKNTSDDVHSYENKEIEDLKAALIRFKEEETEFMNMENKIEIGLYLFDNQALKDKIKLCATVCLGELQRLMPELIYKKANSFLAKMSDMSNKISFNVTETSNQYVEQFVIYMDNVAKIGQELDEYTAENSEIGALLYLILEFKLKIPESYKNKVSEANTQIISIRKKVEEANAAYDQNLTKCKRRLDKMVPELNSTLKEINEKVSNSKVGDKNAEIEKIVQFLNDMNEDVENIYNQSLKMTQWENALQLEVHRFDNITDFKEEFTLLKRMWSSRKEFLDSYNIWRRMQFRKINMEEVSSLTERVTKVANLCSKELEVNEVSRIFKLEVDGFREVLETLQSLRDPALGEKQWKTIRELYSTKTSQQQYELFIDLEDTRYTLEFIIGLNMMEHKEYLQEVALKAAKEAELIKLVENVELFWRSTFLNVIPYKDLKDVFVLGNNDDLISKLDDTLLILNNILGSRYVEGIRNRVEQQTRLFRYLQELLDEWMLHQRNWIYLEPILSTGASHVGLAKESKLFANADASWKKIMKRARDHSMVKSWAEDCTTRSHFITLSNNNKHFEAIQKALDDYLEKKREAFPKFFFLSNEELLDILSKTKTPESIIPYLRKCFENIAFLDFNKGEIASNMFSAEGESVALRSCTARGEVEDWFKNIEESMKSSLKWVFRISWGQYESDECIRKDWVLAYPSQVVLGVDSIYWTKITEEEYLNPDSYGDLDEWFNINVMQLEDLIALIRGSLSSVKRKVLVALVTQDVHYRDIIEQMRNEGVETINDFKWLQQLRFYTEDDGVYAKQVNSRLNYGYEYLGATTRLVITPLTDRCWMTITSALQIKLGAQPAGPAGTGKTESCKDLAKALGKYCIVFNCSEQINVKMMEKLFMGLCHTGSWACLDEFNRIDIEVLSVIAQQVLTIREGLLENRSQLNFFTKTITLNSNIGVFITMNPGYAGRTELPDNLKVLFRPISMMVPDYTLIAEIMLFSEGFSGAKELSVKMTKLYKLSSEQLSQQDHYDFGMRAVKSVLVMAGQVKRAEPKAKENIILIRAMRDSNVPKLLSHDIPLFNAILSDLFPGVEIPGLSNTDLVEAINIYCKGEMLNSESTFIEKTLQLHETVKVRFGTMLVGPTMGGKSTIIKTLKSCYNYLRTKNHPDQSYQMVESVTLNPKSISMDELYGEFDPDTASWTDGLASKLMRAYVELEGPEKKFVIFDGPVDSLWIENMNTVLDDSMTLCLSNGERIKLKPDMKMLFEVMDLAAASPATVSRCGMVFVDQDVVGYAPIVESYFRNSLSQLLQPEHLKYLHQLFGNNFKKGIAFIRKKCTELITTVDNNLAMAICRYLKMILETDKSRKCFETPETSKRSLDRLFMFAYSWGMASSLKDLDKFDKFLSDVFPAHELPKGSIYQYFLELGKAEASFTPWTQIIPDFEYKVGSSYFDLIVHTQDTVCFSWFIEKSVNTLTSTFLTGVTGTGKTIIVNSTLNKLKAEGIISNLNMTFSAQTSSESTQYQIEGRLQTQRKNKRNMLLPPPGRKFVIFVDDINMPQVEIYGAQPPIELLRQLQDLGGFYDRKNHFWKEVENTLLLVAAAPPTGGRNQLTPRFSRHFNIMTVQTTSEDSLKLIFSSILKGFLKTGTFRPEVQELAENDSIVMATLSIYFKISAELLPTPNKSHYTFNLRDVSKIFQGLLQAKHSAINNQDTMIKLWIHECCRVFHDRLINETDQEWFTQMLTRQLFIYFRVEGKHDELFRRKDLPLMFADFLNKNVDTSARVYAEVTEVHKLTKAVREYMSEGTKLNLVLFRDALEHLARIARVLRQERGHFMFVGVGGSGKKSLTTLGAVMAACQIKSVEPRKVYGRAQFREDLTVIMKMVGIEEKSIAFLFADSHILQEGFLEDINNLLNSGEVPNMLTKEDMDEINSGVISKEGEPYQVFVDRVRRNFHVVLAMSPVGGLLRNRMRKFPSLVNCCTIDWLNPWPEEALFSVGSMFLETVEGVTKEMIPSIAKLCVFVHQNVNEEAENYYKLLRRKVYTTPKSYIDLINSYKDLLKMKREELSTSKSKLSNGLFKLSDAKSLIADLKIKLTELEPILKEKTIEQEKILKKLDNDRSEATKVKEIVTEEQRVVNDQYEKIMEMKNEANKILEEALPTLQAATDALNTLNRNDIAEIKSNSNPHLLVKFTLECIAILLDEKPDWDTIKKILADPNFLSRMKNLNVYSIPKNIQTKIKSKIESNPSFVPNEFRNINIAAKSMCEWVRAVASFTDVWKQIEKKKKYVEEKDAELESANAKLKVKVEESNAVAAKVLELEDSFNKNKKEKEKIDTDIQKTEQRLQNASQLTEGLADEEVRWKETLIELTDDLNVLVGNAFIAGASVSYYGPFTGQFRDKMVEKWINKAVELEIPCSENYSLQKVLGNPLLIREWNAKGLPSDKVSVNNGIVASYCRSYPLMIDPQRQANKWIKNMEAKSLKVLKLTSDNLIKLVEMTIRTGQTLLIEDIEEQLDPMLEPLLMKQFSNDNNRKILKLGDSSFEFDDNFKLYFSTKLANPHFLPEIFIRVTVINFTVTEAGLEEQLLGDVVRREMPEIELTRIELVVSIAKDKVNLKKNEDKILDLLNNSKGFILDDTDLINSLKESKITSTIVKEKLQEAEEKQKEIEAARMSYKEVAARGSILYFVVADLSLIDPMYQFSLFYFTRLFNMVIQNLEKVPNPRERIKMLMIAITETIYSNVCRGLFNDHKRIFSFLVASQISLKEKQHINPLEWNTFVKGMPMGEEDTKEFAKPEFVQSEKAWRSLLYLAKNLPIFKEVAEKFALKEWETWFVSPNPHLTHMPGKFNDALTNFQKLLLVKVLREEKSIYALSVYVEAELGKKYTTFNASNMEEVFADTTNKNALIFILSPGADPLTNLLRFARDKKIAQDKLSTISLGQGQEQLAEKTIDQAAKGGGWAILQNCHLGKSFMPALEKKIDSLEEMEVAGNLNANFRLFLTSMPCSYFPVSVLQNGVKLTNEPPKGLKANILKTYNELSLEKFDGCVKPVWKKLLFSFSFFHAIVQERRKFGSLGWNILYEFNDSDLETSITMLKGFLETNNDTPWDAIRFVTGEINYGGRVTDDWDRRCLLATLQRFCQEEVLVDNFNFSPSGLYKNPPVGGLEEYKAIINDFPEIESPDVFGMHENANITFQMKESTAAIQTILNIQPREVGGGAGTDGKTPDETVVDLCSMLEEKLPLPLTPENRKENPNAPVKNYMDSTIICLQQESERFNRLLSEIRDSISNLKKAIKGESVMSADLDKMYQSLLNNQVPEIWAKKAYPSVKSLASWYQDLLDRVLFFQKWIEESPKAFWLSAFFFPQGFLTSLLQNFSRKKRLPIDLLSFAFVFSNFTTLDLIKEAPIDGCFIYGLFVEGCRIDINKSQLEESHPGVLYTVAPVIHFVPTENYKSDPNEYQMPVYKTPTRAGTLSTTGQSTNFIIAIDCPTKKKPSFWVMNGAAFTCSLYD